MAAQAKKTATQTQWAHAAIWEHTFSASGMHAKVKAVPLGRAMLGGGFPNELAGIAAEVEFKGIKDDEVPEWDPEKQKAWLDLQDWLIAECLQEPKVSPEWVRDSFPVDDRPEALQIALHGRFKDEATATLLGLAKFLQGAAGPLASGNGEANGSAGE